MTPGDYTFPLEIRKQPFDMFSGMIAGFQITRTEEGYMGVIHFNPTQFLLIAPRDEDRKFAMKQGIIKKRVHCLHAMLNPKIFELQLQLADLVKDQIESLKNGNSQITRVLISKLTQIVTSKDTTRINGFNETNYFCKTS